MGGRIFISLALTVLIVAVGFGVYSVLFRSDESASAEQPPRTRAAPKPSFDRLRPVTVLAVTNGVASRSQGEPWQPVVPWQTLGPDAELKTSSTGRATLDVDGVTVEIDADTRVSVPGITETVRRVRLGEGRVSARVPGRADAGTFGVTVEGSDIVAETAEGEFAVLTTGEGGATVAATEATVQVTAKGREVMVREGHQTIVPPGQPPSHPHRIPTSLFLKVQRPQRVQRTRITPIQGLTNPGTAIQINGRDVTVDEEGAFTAVVQLKEGKNIILIRGRDASGREGADRIPVTVDTRGPHVGGTVQWEH